MHVNNYPPYTHLSAPNSKVFVYSLLVIWPCYCVSQKSLRSTNALIGSTKMDILQQHLAQVSIYKLEKKLNHKFRVNIAVRAFDFNNWQNLLVCGSQIQSCQDYILTTIVNKYIINIFYSFLIYLTVIPKVQNSKWNSSIEISKHRTLHKQP